jgi:hypothetical protein
MSDETVVYEYTLQQAIADGVLVELFKTAGIRFPTGNRSS